MGTNGQPDVEKVEQLGWLLLDVADYLRQPASSAPVEKRMRTVLRAKIITQLNRQERAGDPLRITPKIREFLSPGPKTRRSVRILVQKSTKKCQKVPKSTEKYAKRHKKALGNSPSPVTLLRKVLTPS